MKAFVPPDEEQRLATLRQYDIMDTPAEPEFDDFTLLAAQICQVPTAMVSFVDEKRQWFKSRIGIGAAETSREIAFCTHTILRSDSILEVRDAQADARFIDNPLVTSEPHIRFYAGAPLVAPNGQAVGALCVMDNTPRTLTEEQRAGLRALSRHVVGQLELRRQARALQREVAERLRIEARLRAQFEELDSSGVNASRLLIVAEKSRRALLSVLEDEKRSGLKLRESEERFRQLTENINEVFWMSEPASKAILYISPAYESIWGRTCESLYANPASWADSIHRDDRIRVAEAARLGQSSGAYDEVYRIARPDGAQRWIHDRAFPVRNESGEIYRIVGTAEDVTQRKRAELYDGVLRAVAAVLSEAATFSEVARRILEIVCLLLEWTLGDLWTVDRSTRTLRCAETWQPPSQNYQDFADENRKLSFVLGEGFLGRIWNGKRSEWISDLAEEKKFLRRFPAAELGLKSALAFPISMRNEIFGVMEFFCDRTRPEDEQMLGMCTALGAQIGQFIERKQLEDQFRQAQKMEAIGTLAGGIAHDFNNVLTAITGFTELAQIQSQDNPEVLEYLKAVLEGSGRAADLVRQILTFSRLQEQERKSIQLWPVIDEALKLLRATIPTTIQFNISLIHSGTTVMADSTQVHQIVMNLATNAAYAMKGRPGRLGVSLEDVDVDADLAALHPGLRPGKYMRLGISDNGHGMEPATLSRIFDPFFTTKAPGVGTGLGLAVVHGIMQTHDGVISVYSQPGEGTRFHLYFPADFAGISEAVAKSEETPWGQGECILFLDDEKPLASMGEKILGRLGYAVESYTSPADAVAAVTAEPNKYDLIITDLTMPGMTGIDFSEQVLKLRPNLPIILTTGYSATVTPERVRGLGLKEMLLKPLTIHGLGVAIHRVLAESKKPPS